MWCRATELLTPTEHPVTTPCGAKTRLVKNCIPALRQDAFPPAVALSLAQQPLFLI
jgi:hypothetical protein